MKVTGPLSYHVELLSGHVLHQYVSPNILMQYAIERFIIQDLNQLMMISYSPIYQDLDLQHRQLHLNLSYVVPLDTVIHQTDWNNRNVNVMS